MFLEVNIDPLAPLQNPAELFLKEKLIKSSGFGFQNEWVSIQIGRGAENWGAGNDIVLALGDNCENYDYLMLSSFYFNIIVI